MAESLPFVTAVLLGLLHSIDLDHAMAVSAFVGPAPSARTAVGFGLRWGLGHSATVTAVGMALVLAGVRLGPTLDVWAERAVGVALVAVGLWSFRAVRNLHAHPAPAHGDHAHLHAHGTGTRAHDHAHGPGTARPRHHPRGITWLGVLHGLAGSSAVLALVPVTLLASPGAGLLYLLLFSVGVTGGMMFFAFALAVTIRRATSRSVEWGRRIGRAIAVASVATGVFWLASG
jgi:high-affinity nickel-transport protein